MWTLQITERFAYETEAKEALDQLNGQVGFLGGTYRTENNWHFHVQAFFRANKPIPGDDPRFACLPDGAKHVFVPDFLQKWYGFKEAK